jgi:hypothetical protein
VRRHRGESFCSSPRSSKLDARACNQYRWAQGGAGVAKALLGKAVLPDDLPFVTGAIGLLGTKPSWDLMMDCDTLLMVGSSFPYSEFLPEEGRARGVQIDLNGRMLGIRYPMEVQLVGESAGGGVEGAGQERAQHRAARRRALQRGRVNPLPPLPAQLHTARHGTRPPARPTLKPAAHPASASTSLRGSPWAARRRPAPRGVQARKAGSLGAIVARTSWSILSGINRVPDVGRRKRSAGGRTGRAALSRLAWGATRGLCWSHWRHCRRSRQPPPSRRARALLTAFLPGAAPTPRMTP